MWTWTWTVNLFEEEEEEEQEEVKKMKMKINGCRKMRRTPTPRCNMKCRQAIPNTAAEEATTHEKMRA